MGNNFSGKYAPLVYLYSCMIQHLLPGIVKLPFTYKQCFHYQCISISLFNTLIGALEARSYVIVHLTTYFTCCK